MAPLVYVMAILGCGDDGAACTRERIAPATFATVAECQAAVPAMLTRNTDLSYPVIMADCQAGSRETIAQAQSMVRRNG
ncbi:hypothetical protein [Sphingomonas sp. VNH70]|uniref:hypothetical protein n=1 Tax=Sphingomonas silueang TaxID=3156617 RepID=UPI0032B4AB49